MLSLPPFIPGLFILTTFLTVGFSYLASRNNKILLIVLTAWLLLQGIISFKGFYTVTDTVPPRFLLLVLPPLIAIIILFVTRKGRRFIDQFDLNMLTLLHIVRIPVEIVLYLLFIYRAVPELMTFEGRNFDILAGITAPVVYYIVKQGNFNKRTLLGWNIICLGLLLNIVVHAVLSAPSPVQQLAFDRPNIAVLYFPFVWLPCCVVPLVLFSHLVAIRRLTR